MQTDTIITQPDGQIVHRWEPPDFLRSAFSGHIDGLTMPDAAIRSQGYTASVPYCLALRDVSRMLSLSAAARRASAHNGAKNLRGVAVVGTSFHFGVRIRFASSLRRTRRGLGSPSSGASSEALAIPLRERKDARR